MTTPGPWHWGEGWTVESIGTEEEDGFDGEKYADLGLYGANGTPILPLVIDHHRVEFDAGRSLDMIPTADRALIAAAPDLLRAAKHLFACDIPASVDFRCPQCEAARTAIAKAEGRS